MDVGLNWSRKVEAVLGLAVEANLGLEAEIGQDRNHDQDQNLLVDHDHLLLVGLVRDQGRWIVGEQDPGLVSVVQDPWTGKMEHRVKDQLLAVEVVLQKEADHDLDLKTERTEMETSRITMSTKINKHICVQQVLFRNARSLSYGNFSLYLITD